MDGVHNLNSTSNRLLITIVISTLDYRHFLNIDIGCMSVHNRTLHRTVGTVAGLNISKMTGVGNNFENFNNVKA